MLKLVVNKKERIDKYISDNTEISRNDAKELIEQGAVYINNNVQVRKANYIVREGFTITLMKLLEKETDIKPVNIPLNIKYEDDHIIVIDKPSGLVVHPAPGHLNDTLVNGLLYHFQTLSNNNGLLRPGIVHRIDKDTSGLLIIAKTNEVHNILAKMLKNHEIHRSYISICDGILKNKITKINLPIQRSTVDRKTMAINKYGKDSVTYVYLLKTFYLNNKPYSLVNCQLETGRTHQIRVHLAYIKHPVYGDPIYGKEVDDFNQRLHAYKLEFKHPISNENIIIYSNIPEEFNIADYNFELLKQENI